MLHIPSNDYIEKFSPENNMLSGEALPQLILSCVFIAANGGPFQHMLNTTSAFFSATSFLYGFIISVDAFIKNRKEKVALQYRQTLGMPYN